MKKVVILFADNDENFLETRRESLEQEGYKVMPALGPDEAREILKQSEIDIAIIDIRLLNDKDEKDLSGLNLAKIIPPRIPKIILTNFPNVDEAREALAPQLDGTSLAVDFLAKIEGPQALLTAIRKILKRDNNFKELNDTIIIKIDGDYSDARQQARGYYWASLVVAIIGMLVVVVSVGLMMAHLLSSGIPGAVVGVIGEAVSVLFFRQANITNIRMDGYHQELLQTCQLENLLAACDELVDNEGKEKCKEKIIMDATKLWFSRRETKNQTSLEKSLEG
jgi:CheY-like chemotaxis protein